MGTQVMQQYGVSGVGCSKGSDAGCPEGGCCMMIKLSGLENLGPMGNEMKEAWKKVGINPGGNYFCTDKPSLQKFEKENGGRIDQEQNGVKLEMYCANAIKTGVVAGVLAAATIAVNI